EHPGFRKNLIAGLNLIPGENHLNTQLQIGSVAESVEVTAGSTALNATSATVAAGKMLSGVANRPHVSTGFVAGGAGGLFRAGVPAASPPASLEEARAVGQSAAAGQDLGDLF